MTQRKSQPEAAFHNANTEKLATLSEAALQAYAYQEDLGSPEYESLIRLSGYGAMPYTTSTGMPATIRAALSDELSPPRQADLASVAAPASKGYPHSSSALHELATADQANADLATSRASAGASAGNSTGNSAAKSIFSIGNAVSLVGNTPTFADFAERARRHRLTAAAIAAVARDTELASLSEPLHSIATTVDIWAEGSNSAAGPEQSLESGTTRAQVPAMPLFSRNSASSRAEALPSRSRAAAHQENQAGAALSIAGATESSASLSSTLALERDSELVPERASAWASELAPERAPLTSASVAADSAALGEVYAHASSNDYTSSKALDRDNDLARDNASRHAAMAAVTRPLSTVPATSRPGSVSDLLHLNSSNGRDATINADSSAYGRTDSIAVGTASGYAASHVTGTN